MKKEALLLLSLALATAARGETALWAVRTELSTPASIRGLCSEAKEAGVDTILAQVRGRGDAWYETALAPRSEELSEPPPFDPLGVLVKECEGVKNVAWLNAFFVWGGQSPPSSPLHPANAHPEWVLMDSEKRRVSEYSPAERAKGWIEGFYADPASEEYRALFASIAGEVVKKYPVAGVHLDFIRYPGPGYGQGGPLAERYKTLYGLDPALLPVSFGLPDLGKWLSGEMKPEERVLLTGRLLFAGMKAGEITKTVRAVAKEVKAARSGAGVSAAVVPEAGTAYFEKGQDWRGWAAEGLVDGLYPMVYFGPKERVSGELLGIAAEAASSAPSVSFHAGLGGYIKEPADICAEAAVASELGFDGVSLFDAGSLRKKPGGISSYTDCLKSLKRAPRAAAPKRTALPEEPILKAVAGSWPDTNLPPGWESAAREREREFREAVKADIPALLARLETEGFSLPGWIEAKGIFRYVHQLDPPEKVMDQFRKAEEALQKLSAGEDFSKVAGELSQWGTRSCGGALGRVFPGGDTVIPASAGGLKAGETSRILRGESGFWILKVDSAGAGEQISWAKADFASKREALRVELGKLYESRKATPAPDGGAR